MSSSGACRQSCLECLATGRVGGSERKRWRVRFARSEPCGTCRKRCGRGSKWTRRFGVRGCGNGRIPVPNDDLRPFPCGAGGTTSRRRCCRGSSTSRHRAPSSPSQSARCREGRWGLRGKRDSPSPGPSRSSIPSQGSCGTRGTAGRPCPFRTRWTSGGSPCTLRASVRCRGTSRRRGTSGIQRPPCCARRAQRSFRLAFCSLCCPRGTSRKVPAQRRRAARQSLGRKATALRSARTGGRGSWRSACPCVRLEVACSRGRRRCGRPRSKTPDSSAHDDARRSPRRRRRAGGLRLRRARSAAFEGKRWPVPQPRSGAAGSDPDWRSAHRCSTVQALRRYRRFASSRVLGLSLARKQDRGHVPPTEAVRGGRLCLHSVVMRPSEQHPRLRLRSYLFVRRLRPCAGTHRRWVRATYQTLMPRKRGILRPAKRSMCYVGAGYAAPPRRLETTTSQSH